MSTPKTTVDEINYAIKYMEKFGKSRLGYIRLAFIALKTMQWIEKVSRGLENADIKVEAIFDKFQKLKKEYGE